MPKTKWREYVNREFLEVDNKFVEALPYKSIDAATFGFITEASRFVLVKTKEEVHIKPLTSGLRNLKHDLKASSSPGGDFSLDDAIGALEKFSSQWEEKIKDRDKWDRVVKLARDEDQIVSEEQFLSGKSKRKSFLSNLLDFFK
ncbi:MAG: hypothetical protein ACOCZX_00635 [Candidatus Bipolaricaulota bacterium]